MPIRRGEPWGEQAPRPPDAIVVTSDAAVAERLGDRGADGRADGAPLVVAGGDLWRSLGRPLDRDPVQVLPVDVLEVSVDGRAVVAVAHVVARRSWWRGPIVAALNVGSVGDWDVAPRAHPNDGRLDVVEVSPGMSLRQRWQARSRLPHGTHLPHPAIAVRAATSCAWTFDRPVRVWVDGRSIGRGRSIAVRVVPDAVRVAA